MVEPILYATFGALLATLIGLLFLPAFWGRAVRLTTKRLVGRLPVSLPEIVAAQDRLRAEHAMALRAVERRSEQAVEQAAQDRAETARARAEDLGRMADLADLRARVALLEAEGKRVKVDLDRTGAEAAELAAALKAASLAERTLRADLDAARKDAAAAKLATEQSRIEATAREAEVALLRMNAAGSARAIDEARRGLDAKDERGSEMGRRIETETARAAEAEAARVAAERRLVEETATVVALRGQLVRTGDRTLSEAELGALRARLDEVADAIVRASADSPAVVHEEPVAKKPAAGRRVRERAGAG